MKERDMKYREKQFQMQNRMAEMFQESLDMQKDMEYDPNANLNIYTESARESLNWGDRDNSKELLFEEYQEKLQDVTRDLFISCVVEGCNIDYNIIKLNESEIEAQIGDVFDALLENGIIKNMPDGGAWDVITKTAAKHARISANSKEVCFNETVNDCATIFRELTSLVRDKVNKAAKFENFNTVLKEDGSLRKHDKKTMFRTLLESNYKSNIAGEEDQIASLNESVQESLTATSMIQTAIDYAILETCNTARIIDVDREYFEKAYRVLGR